MKLLKKNRAIKKVPEGFSWTTLLFGFFPALFRGDITYALIIFLTNIMTFGIAGIVWAFIYNENYKSRLLADGWNEDAI